MSHPGFPSRETPRDPEVNRDEPVTIDCDTCAVRGLACSDCVVTVLLGPPADLDLGAEELDAIDALASSGLVPPLRMVRGVDEEEQGPA